MLSPFFYDIQDIVHTFRTVNAENNIYVIGKFNIAGHGDILSDSDRPADRLQGSGTDGLLPECAVPAGTACVC